MKQCLMVFETLCVLLIATTSWSVHSLIEQAGSVSDNHNIHAIMVSSSRYWFNYRHAMNALAIYQILQSNGVPDDQMVLMLADEYAINARNPHKNGMYANGVQATSWYSNRTHVDYRGADVTVRNFLDATLGVAKTKSLQSNADSNLLIYVSGHGGDQFFKFQDEEELTAQDIANLAEELWKRGRYKQLLFIADTCQAFTLFDKIQAPNVLALGTSLRNENAYAHHADNDLGLSVIERWTHAFVQRYSKLPATQLARTSLFQVMVAPFVNPNVLGAKVGIREDTSPRKFQDVTLAEFFGNPLDLVREQSHSRRLPTVEPMEIRSTGTDSIAVLPPPEMKQSLATQHPNNDYERSPARNDDRVQQTVEQEDEDVSFYYLTGALVALLLMASRMGRISSSSTS